MTFHSSETKQAASVVQGRRGIIFRRPLTCRARHGDVSRLGGYAHTMRVRLLGAIIALALMTTQTNAVPIAHCLLKPYAEVRAVPSTGGPLLLSVPNELRVELLKQFGNRWVWVSTDAYRGMRGWVLRSSLKFCLERSPFRKLGVLNFGERALPATWTRE